MEQATDPQPPGSSNERLRRGGTRSTLSIYGLRNVKLAAPPGARFKDYASFVVQDLLIRPNVGKVRPHLHPQDRLRHPRPLLARAACQQSRIADGAGPKFRFTPTGQRTMSAARSPSAR
jgi:hypothetical protein